jgi:hypothetical protein
MLHVSMSRPKQIKKKLRFYFLFILVRTTTKSMQFINKPVFLFLFFPCCCFAFISKQQQQKNRHFIYDLSMLWLCLDQCFPVAMLLVTILPSFTTFIFLFIDLNEKFNNKKKFISRLFISFLLYKKKKLYTYYCYCYY